MWSKGLRICRIWAKNLSILCSHWGRRQWGATGHQWRSQPVWWPISAGAWGSGNSSWWLGSTHFVISVTAWFSPVYACPEGWQGGGVLPRGKKKHDITLATAYHGTYLRDSTGITEQYCMYCSALPERAPSSFCKTKWKQPGLYAWGEPTTTYHPDACFVSAIHSAF